MDGTFDVMVAGAGPAGLAIAASAARVGLHVCCVAPDAEAPWTNNYGAWVDEVAALELAHVFERTWARAVVHFDARRTRTLTRAYGRIDGARLRQALLHRGGERLTLVTAGVRKVTHTPEGTRADLDDGRTFSARVFVDASGAGARFIERAGPPADAFQIAYGIMAHVKQHPYALDEMGFMDFRDEFLAERGGPPTFLYAMPFGPTQIFLEETSLVCRPPLDFAFCEARLRERLAFLGIEVERVDWEERCRIPMNAPLPVLGQRAIGFGAAAGFVHPASGYSVTQSLALAPALAELLARGLADGLSPDALSRRAWALVWPRGRLRMRRVHLFGMELFVRSGARGLRLFLGTFFRAPVAFWHGYLSGTSTPGGLLRALMGRATPRLKP